MVPACLSFMGLAVRFDPLLPDDLTALVVHIRPEVVVQEVRHNVVCFSKVLALKGTQGREFFWLRF